MSTKEQYWKYSLIAIIIGLGIILFRQIAPFMGGLLGALTIYILVRKQMMYLSDKRKMKRKHSCHPHYGRGNSLLSGSTWAGGMAGCGQSSKHQSGPASHYSSFRRSGQHH